MKRIERSVIWRPRIAAALIIAQLCAMGAALFAGGTTPWLVFGVYAGFFGLMVALVAVLAVKHRQGSSLSVHDLPGGLIVAMLVWEVVAVGAAILLLTLR